MRKKTYVAIKFDEIILSSLREVALSAHNSGSIRSGTCKYLIAGADQCRKS